MECLVNNTQLDLPEEMCTALGGEPLYPPQYMDDNYIMQDIQYPQVVLDQYQMPVRSGSGGYAWSAGSPSPVKASTDIGPIEVTPLPNPEPIPEPVQDTGSYWGGPGTWANQFTQRPTGRWNNAPAQIAVPDVIYKEPTPYTALRAENTSSGQADFLAQIRKNFEEEEERQRILAMARSGLLN